MDAASSDFKDKSTKKNFDQEEYGPWIKWNKKNISTISFIPQIEKCVIYLLNSIFQ